VVSRPGRPFLYRRFRALAGGLEFCNHCIGGSSSFSENARVFGYTNVLEHLRTAAWFIAGRLYLCERQVPKLIPALRTIMELALSVGSGAVVHVLSLVAAGMSATPLSYVCAVLAIAGPIDELSVWLSTDIAPIQEYHCRPPLSRAERAFVPRPGTEVSSSGCLTCFTRAVDSRSAVRPHNA